MSNLPIHLQNTTTTENVVVEKLKNYGLSDEVINSALLSFGLSKMEEAIKVVEQCRAPSNAAGLYLSALKNGWKASPYKKEKNNIETSAKKTLEKLNQMAEKAEKIVTEQLQNLFNEKINKELPQRQQIELAIKLTVQAQETADISIFDETRGLRQGVYTSYIKKLTQKLKPFIMADEKKLYEQKCMETAKKIKFINKCKTMFSELEYEKKRELALFIFDKCPAIKTFCRNNTTTFLDQANSPQFRNILYESLAEKGWVRKE